MSLAIDQDHITRVLIGNEWHAVDPLTGPGAHASSFAIDAYEIGADCDDAFDPLYRGGPGFTFLSHGRRISGPITSIQAITHSEHEPADLPSDS